MGNRSKLTLELAVDDTGSVVVKQFGENTQRAFKQAETSGIDLGQSLSYVKGILLTLAAAIGIAFGVSEVVNFTKDVTALAARVETLGVVMSVVGENAGYSRAETTKYADEVRKMGITTSASEQSVIKLAQAQIDLSKSSQLARIAQDAAVIGNINSSEAFERMINGIRSGEVEILKTIGIAVNFEQAYQKQAQTLGKTVAALSEREKAQARANAVIEAGTRIEGAYEASMTTAGKQILSMSRYFEEIKLKIGEAFGPALSAVVQAFTADLKKVQEYFEDAAKSGKAAEWAVAIKDAATKAYDAFTSLGKIVFTTAKYLDDFWEVAKGVAAGFAAYFVLKILAAADAVSSLLWYVKNAGFVMQYFAATTLPALMNPVGLAAVAIGGLATAFFLYRDSAKEAERATDAFAMSLKGLTLEQQQRKLSELEEKLIALRQEEAERLKYTVMASAGVRARYDKEAEAIEKQIALVKSSIATMQRENEASEARAAAAAEKNKADERAAELQRKQTEQAKILAKVEEDCCGLIETDTMLRTTD